ncbi:MAG: hypothetical protein ACLSAH_01785 [Bilophila wadsworthia]
MPVLCGTAFRNIGVQPLLDAVVNYLPSPLDIDQMVGHNPDKPEEIVCPSSDKEPLAGLVFKLASDPRGPLGLLPYLLGRDRSRLHVVQRQHRQEGTPWPPARMHANKREDIKSAGAGDIVALVGMKLPPPATRSATKSARGARIPRYSGTGHRSRHRTQDEDRP